MQLDTKFLNIQFLVFSSHKTATQSVTESLTVNGFTTLHCHYFLHMGIPPEKFLDYLLRYKSIHKRPIKIISIFREPIERIISSFFQSLSVDIYGRTENFEVPLTLPEQSILYTESTEAIQKRFYYYCEKYNGFGESIGNICETLVLPISQLNFSISKGFGKTSFELFDIYLYRYDLLLNNFSDLMAQSLGHQITMVPKNISNTKWYFDKYLEFKQNLKIPKDIILHTYQSRIELINLFYPGQYEHMLEHQLNQYGI